MIKTRIIIKESGREIIIEPNDEIERMEVLKYLVPRKHDKTSLYQQIFEEPITPIKTIREKYISKDVKKEIKKPKMGRPLLNKEKYIKSIVEWRKEGFSSRKIKHLIFEKYGDVVSFNTILRWVEEEEIEKTPAVEKITKPKKTGPKTRLTEEIENTIRENLDLSHNDLAKKINEKHGIQISFMTARAWKNKVTSLKSEKPKGKENLKKDAFRLFDSETSDEDVSYNLGITLEEAKNFREEWWRVLKTRENLKTSIGLEEDVVCPSCGSSKTIRTGRRLIKEGSKQRYKCKSCRNRFVLSPHYGRPEKITDDIKSIIEENMDMPLRKLSKKIYDESGEHISYQTVGKWKQMIEEEHKKSDETDLEENDMEEDNDIFESP